MKCSFGTSEWGAHGLRVRIGGRYTAGFSRRSGGLPGAVSVAPPPRGAALPLDRSERAGGGGPQLVGGHAARVAGEVLQDDRREQLLSRIPQDGHHERVGEVGGRRVDDRVIARYLRIL